jgi:hypothetical protein
LELELGAAFFAQIESRMIMGTESADPAILNSGVHADNSREVKVVKIHIRKITFQSIVYFLYGKGQQAGLAK